MQITCDVELSKSLNFVENNRVYIQGSFDESISKHVIPYLLKIITNREQTIIYIYISSDGGCVYFLKELLALFELAKSKGMRIETYVLARAYSCGSILASAGSKGFRFISSNAEHLCHLGASSTGYVFNDKELERSTERAKSHFDFVRSVYKKYANIENLEDAIKNDNYFIRGKDIIKNGLADEIIDE